MSPGAPRPTPGFTVLGGLGHELAVLGCHHGGSMDSVCSPLPQIVRTTLKASMAPTVSLMFPTAPTASFSPQIRLTGASIACGRKCPADPRKEGRTPLGSGPLSRWLLGDRQPRGRRTVSMT